MKRNVLLFPAFFIACLCPAIAQQTGLKCVDCPAKVTPSIVSDWKLSKHSAIEVGCDTCHGDEHTSASDVANVKILTRSVCLSRKTSNGLPIAQLFCRHSAYLILRVSPQHSWTRSRLPMLSVLPRKIGNVSATRC
jgi:hypothetical protein